MSTAADKNCVTLPDGSCISPRDCMHGPGALHYATVKELLEEVEKRGIRVAEAGWYESIGRDMAIGARNLLDSLPVSILNATAKEEAG